MLKKIFVKKATASIDIGTSSIKALTLSKGKIDRVIKKKIIDIDEKGDIIDNALEATLISIIEELGLKRKNINISLSGQKFYNQEMQLSQEELENKEEFIQSELESVVPNFDPLDFITKEIEIEEERNEKKIMAITIEREKIEEILDIMKRNKVTVLKIIPDFIASCQLLEKIIEADFEDEYEGVTTIVDMGHEGTKISFVDRYGLKMFMNTMIGGKDFTEIIKRHKLIPLSEAEKQKEGLELGENQVLNNGEKEMFDELTLTFKELEENISLSIRHFGLNNVHLSLNKIVLIGGGAFLQGFKSYLIENKGAAVRYIECNNLEMCQNLEAKLGNINLIEIAGVLGNIINEVS